MSLSMAVVSMAAPPMAALSMAAVSLEKDLSISRFNQRPLSIACPYLDVSNRDLETWND